MATYYPITIEEMDALLKPQGFAVVNPIDLPNCQEIVYSKAFHSGTHRLAIRIFTGIINGQSRDVGDDAIRVNIVMKTPVGGRIIKLGGQKRVHRVKGWAKNLQDRIDNFWNFPKIVCPRCGLPMIPKDGSHGKFLACVGFDRTNPNCCRYTKNI